MSITHDDWLKAIAETMPPPPVEDAITVMEFAALAICADSTARVRLNKMCQDGLARRVRKQIRATDGRVLRVGAYQLIKAKHK